jgi:hypothetical protein
VSERQVIRVRVSPYRIVFAILDQPIVRVVGSVRGGCAGVVFERVVGGHFAYLQQLSIVICLQLNQLLCIE